MLLFKCSCGNACCAQDTEVGQNIVCDKCKEKILVPSNSDADCVLLFRRGDPETGKPMTSTEFQHALNREDLYCDDLIWKDHVWLPLGKVYELPPQPAIAIDSSQQEIALDFQDLPAVDGYPKAPKKKKRIVKFDVPTAAAPESPTVGKPVNLKKRILNILKAAVIIAVLSFGGIRLGRIVNFFLKRVSNVMVVNTFDVPCKFKLSEYEWQELPKNSQVTQPDVYVAFSCRKKMLFMESSLDPISKLPAKEGEVNPVAILDPASLRVPIKPGYDTVVNPGGRATFGVYDLSTLPKLSISSPELKSLSNELAEAKPPVSVLNVIQQIQNLVKNLYKESRQDTFLTSRKFNFDALGIVRSIDFSKSSETPAKEKETKEKKPLLSLVYPAARMLNFRNGSIFFDPEKFDTECSIALVTKEFKPKKEYSVTAANPRLQIKHEKNFLVLLLSSLNGTTKGAQNAQYKALWNYQAKMNKAGKWTWQWTAKYEIPVGAKKTLEERILIIDQ
ncbi:MAG: hypothetical protein WCT05_11190, partial [Lentisphaeria bacterium]